MKLTVGFSMSHDPGAWWTLNVFQAMHRHIPHEFLVVDNSPQASDVADEFAGHVRANHPEVRYLRDDGPPSSCLYKERLFREATGDVVICMDAHVFLDAGAVESVLAYYEANPESRDLLMGPLQNAAGRVMATNQQLYASEGYQVPKDSTVRHGIVCRGGQLATWVRDPRGLDPNGEPFEIQQNGTGFFAMRREAWPGFHPGFYGFGGNESYLMERVRQEGGRVLCHPACRWTHNFSDAHGRGYKPLAEDKIRNYLVAALALDRKDLYDATIEHFATIHPTSIAPAVAAAERVMAGTFVPKPHAPIKVCQAKDGKGCAAKREQRPSQVKPANASAAQSGEKSRPPEKAGVYERFLDSWKQAGGDAGGAIPKPLFIQVVHTKPTTGDGKKGERPIRTLEFGCGLSTLGFDRQGTEHTAVEHDAKWVERVRPLLKRKETTVVHAPLKDGWYDWRPPYGTLYDLILIDGPPGTIGREGCLSVVPEILAPGGVILIDDTHRDAERNISEALASKLGLRSSRRRHGERSYDVLVPPPEPLGEGPGTELLSFLKSMPKMPSCQLCHNLARQMNAWGPAGCRENLDYIVQDMLPRARAWWKASTPWMKAEAWFKGQGGILSKLSAARSVAVDADAALRESIRDHVLEAIKSCESKNSAERDEDAVLMEASLHP